MEPQTKALVGLAAILGIALVFSMYKAKKEKVVVTLPVDPVLKSTIENIALEIKPK